MGSRYEGSLSISSLWSPRPPGTVCPTARKSAIGLPGSLPPFFLPSSSPPLSLFFLLPFLFSLLPTFLPYPPTPFLSKNITKVSWSPALYLSSLTTGFTRSVPFSCIWPASKISTIKVTYFRFAGVGHGAVAGWLRNGQRCPADRNSGPQRLLGGTGGGCLQEQIFQELLGQHPWTWSSSPGVFQGISFGNKSNGSWDFYSQGALLDPTFTECYHRCAKQCDPCRNNHDHFSKALCTHCPTGMLPKALREGEDLCPCFRQGN